MSHICKWCDKEFETAGKLVGHIRFCEKNPKREENLFKNRQKINKMCSSISNKAKENPLNEVKEYTFNCVKCGKEYTLKLKVKDFERGNYRKTCSRSCANGHKGITTGKTKLVKCIDCGKEIEVHIQCDPLKCRCKECKIKHDNIRYINRLSFYKGVYTGKLICEICGNEFEPKLTKSGKYSSCKCCSDECQHILKVKNGKNAYNKMVENGNFHPWQSRNITSYAEKFWISVLQNNNIEFEREYNLDHKYFLDFYIIKNGKKLDLEIDGKQHLYEDRVIHDQERDEYVKSKDILIYRIPWNNINTDEGSLLMKNKINKFLEFYNNM